MEELLMAILGCGISDLDLVKDSKADFEEIVKYLKDNEIDVDLGSIVSTMYDIAKNKFFQVVDERVEDLNSRDEDDLDDEEKEELEEINTLSEDDFSFYFNYIDTHMSIVKNSDIYEKYFEEEISEFEDYTGFNLER